MILAMSIWGNNKWQDNYMHWNEPFVPENRPFEKWRFHLPTIDFQICSKAFAVSFREGIQQIFLGAKRLRHLKWMTDGCAAFLLGWFSGTCVSFRKGTSYKHWTYIYSQRYAQVLTFWYTKKRSLKTKMIHVFSHCFHHPKRKPPELLGWNPMLPLSSLVLAVHFLCFP